MKPNALTKVVTFTRAAVNTPERARTSGFRHHLEALLHLALPPLIKKWEPRLHVKATGYFLQRMKTKWGGCNHRARNVRLNTELVKKPSDLLEYLVVHEMVHLIEPTHGNRIVETLSKLYPGWREARREPNELPLSEVSWSDC